MSDYYNRNGEPIRMNEWAREFEKDRTVAKTELPDGKTVSTVFLGLNHRFGDGPPLIFETLVFNPGSYEDVDGDRYTTEEQAKAGHEAMVAKWQDKAETA